MRLLLICLLLAGCQATLPSRDIYVTMTHPPCSKGPDVRKVRFVDSALPVTSCIAASTKEDAAKFVLLTMIGMPLAACAVTVYGATPAGDTTTIYAAISPSPTQLVTTAMTLRSSDDILAHEREHAFGEDHGKCRK